MIAFDRYVIVYDWFKNIEKEKQTQDQTQLTCINENRQAIDSAHDLIQSFDANSMQSLSICENNKQYRLIQTTCNTVKPWLSAT